MYVIIQIFVFCASFHYVFFRTSRTRLDKNATITVVDEEITNQEILEHLQIREESIVLIRGDKSQPPAHILTEHFNSESEKLKDIIYIDLAHHPYTETLTFILHTTKRYCHLIFSSLISEAFLWNLISKLQSLKFHPNVPIYRCVEPKDIASPCEFINLT